MFFGTHCAPVPPILPNYLENIIYMLVTFLLTKFYLWISACFQRRYGQSLDSRFENGPLPQRPRSIVSVLNPNASPFTSQQNLA
ncbi:Hypothetical protein SRAE_X000232900 [Strongyloides ratti]|uniref:Uncharacterized protein n=1 Tax=Strongyloides ratti TaxID=34506 RepID=A0A090KZD8_STRRB|nr:Hypothetical protein SRAE_X000232900 [Strongyloides ratti]CEF60594.1 Hypothetical protein SRAE_X000232900 [Strongyloides ratti]